MFNFFPHEPAFFELFNEAAQNMALGSRRLKEMLESYRDVEQKAREIKRIESDGDTLTHTIIKKLNQTFITPIDREDIYGLTSAIDDVLDCVEAVTDQLALYKIERPTPEAIQLAGIIYESTEELCKGIAQLGAGADMSACFITVNSLENDADRITRDAIAKLFEQEKDPLVVMKWKEIYESLEKSTDRCEDVSNILESIAMKRA